MRLAITVVVSVLLMGLTASGRGSQEAAAEHGGWDREGAAKYLDERMDAWFANAKKLRTGQGVTTCVSCHTVVPYALSRPVLRRAMHVSTRTPQEVRLLEGVARRVETYDAHQPFYDGSEGKKTESRGTEAVLNALILSSADAERGRREPSEPTRKALRRLWGTQRPNGAWVLLASTRLKDLLPGAQREALTAEIQRRQHDDGGWSLQALGTWTWGKPAWRARAPGTPDASLLAQSDGYATGLIVYTLRTAGVPVEHPAVRRGSQWLRAHQQDVQVNQRMHHAWRAHSLNFDREHGGEKGEPWRRMFMSDSATAFAVLAL